MMSDRPPEPPVSGTVARRQVVIDALCEAFASDQLSTVELERRLDVATRARTESELAALLEDLTLPKGTAVDRYRAGSAVQERGTREAEGVVVRPSDAPAPARQFSVGIWSGHSRRGTWEPARQITALAVMGGVELDFREAVFTQPVVDVRAVALMGGVEVVVPPGVRVDTSGFAILGGFDDSSELGREAPASAPTLRIGGFAMMGGVSVEVRLPGESASEARRRRRRERREKRGR